MKEKYSRVYTCRENLYAEDAPVVICTGRLLNDNETGKMIVQLKFCNISDKTISYVKVAIKQLDADGKPIGNALSYEYLDLAVANTEEFGAKKPLLLPNDATRMFSAGVCAVGFTDGTLWEDNNIDWKPATQDSVALKALKVVDTYKKALALFASNEVRNVIIARDILESIQEYKDVTAELKECNDWLAAKKARRKKCMIVYSIIAGGLVLLALLAYFGIYPLVSYWGGNYRPYIDIYKVEEFEIPEKATVVNPNAFNMCKSLKHVTIPSGVTAIGENAFADCTNLESVKISNSVTVIERRAFKNCTKLKSITVPGSVTAIKDEAFHGCTKLESITIPKSVKNIGKYAFENCSKLKNVTIEGGAAEIAEYAFRNCTSLEILTLGEGVTTIGWGAFVGCTGLESIIIPKTVTKISGSAFENCTKLTSVTIEEGVSGIGWGAFTGCTSLERIVIPKSVAEIEGLAFGNCTKLSSVTIEDGVSTIGWHAFSGCSGLESITVPKSVTQVDASFYDCEKLQRITYRGTVSQWKTILETYSNDMSDIAVYCTNGDCRYEH